MRVEYENSFKLNLRIASLTLRSADSFGRFVFVDSSAQSVRKIATMSGLSISHSKSGKQAFQDILKPTSISLTLSSSGLFVRISSVLLELNSSQLRDLLHDFDISALDVDWRSLRECIDRTDDVLLREEVQNFGGVTQCKPGN